MSIKSILLVTSVFLLLGCSSQSPAEKMNAERTEAARTTALPANMPMAEDFPDYISVDLANRFSSLAIKCVHQEFPNKISRTTETAEAIGRPKDIFPVFYGCFDWHSAVHGHWLLVRLLRVGPQDAPWREMARVKLNQSFTADNIKGEITNFSRPARGSWERPYGLAWFLQLMTELREWDDPQARVWRDRLAPLEADIAASLREWLPKLAYPIRLGTHNQSAFAFGLMLDWSREVGDIEMERLIVQRSLSFHQGDVNCPLTYEPSGEDFLSPCLMVADLMRRIMGADMFSDWLSDYMPTIPIDGSGDWLVPGIVKDASDGKLVHLDGVNSSRAWNLYNIARALPETDPRRASLVAAAKIHAQTGVAAVSDEHYSGSHWLASFATYLMTDRGWDQ